MQGTTATIGNRLGFALTRVVVPLWVLAGASFKLYERTPSNLPGVILKTAKDMHLDLDMLLRLLIGMEFFAVFVMLFVPRLARSMAIFMLGCFVLILLVEMYRKASSCGCFGSLPFKPWHMLLIDGTLLAGVIFFRPRPRPTEAEPAAKAGWTNTAIVTAVLLGIGLTMSFVVPNRAAVSQIAENGAPKDATGTPDTAPSPAPSDPQTNPAPAAIPNSWYVRTSVQQEWVGKSWRDIDLFKMMRRWPKDLDRGRHYVVFYSRNCDHCEQMFKDYFMMGLDAPVAAVQFPSSRDVMTGEGAWTMPPLAQSVELLDLPLGCSYIVTPPVALTIVDGQVTCAVEGAGFEACLGVN